MSHLQKKKYKNKKRLQVPRGAVFPKGSLYHSFNNFDENFECFPMWVCAFKLFIQFIVKSCNQLTCQLDFSENNCYYYTAVLHRYM